MPNDTTKAPDIFDRVAAKMGTGKTDIFDRVAARMSTPEQQAPNALAQAQAMFPKPGMGLPPGGKELPPAGREFEGGDSYLSMSPTGVATSPLIPAKTQAQVIGAGLGGEAMAGIGAAAKVPAALRMLGTASGAGFGAGAGTLAGGGSPKEALGTAAITTATTAPFLALGEAGSAIKAKLSGKSASELAELSQLPQRETEIRQRVFDGYRAAKATASAAYPEIATPVNVAPAQSVAQQVSEQMLAHNAPSVVGRMAEMGGAQQLQVAGINPDLSLVLRKIATTNNMSFTDAQQLYSALGESIAKGRGQLPGETYNALKAVRDTLGDQMKAAAQADGKLAQFTAAQKGWQKLMDDWQNPGAPMKQILSPASKRQFAVMKKFIGDDGARMVKTMDKYGIETRDIQALQQLGKDAAKTKIADAAELSRMGQEAFQKQAAQQARAETLKRAAQMVGGGGLLYEMYRLAHGR